MASVKNTARRRARAKVAVAETENSTPAPDIITLHAIRVENNAGQRKGYIGRQIILNEQAQLPNLMLPFTEATLGKRAFKGAMQSHTSKGEYFGWWYGYIVVPDIMSVRQNHKPALELPKTIPDLPSDANPEAHKIRLKQIDAERQRVADTNEDNEDIYKKLLDEIGIEASTDSRTALKYRKRSDAIAMLRQIPAVKNRRYRLVTVQMEWGAMKTARIISNT